jgi:DNA-binding winged helix-turn-helix (wHTH) protein
MSEGELALASHKLKLGTAGAYDLREMSSNPDHIRRCEIAFGPFRLFAVERLIEGSGEPLKLGGRSGDVLIALMERAGEVVSQRELIDHVWPNVTVDDRNLRFQVRALRRALGDGRDGARQVINVLERGCCFVSRTTRSPIKSTPPPIGPIRTAPVMPPQVDAKHAGGRVRIQQPAGLG